MKANRWLISLGGVAMVVVAACSSEPSQGWYLVNPQTSRDVVKPSEFMLEVGCTDPGKDVRRGMIGIPLPDSSIVPFDCHGVSLDSIHAARGRYVDAVLAYGSHVEAGYADLIYMGGYDDCESAGGGWSVTLHLDEAETVQINGESIPLAAGDYVVTRSDDVVCTRSDFYVTRPSGSDGEWAPPPLYPPSGSFPIGYTPPPPPPPPPTPPPCPDASVTEDSVLSSPPTYDNSDSSFRVCTDLTCMQSTPGVWVGSHPIPHSGGYLNHTAVAVVTSTSGKVTELIGWDKIPPSANRVHDSIATRADEPYYGGYEDYRWVMAGGGGTTADAERAIDTVKPQFDGHLYTGSSNVFVSNVLAYGHLQITGGQALALGFAPGLNRCSVVVW